jgi:signal transduction histidine kinase
MIQRPAPDGATLTVEAVSGEGAGRLRGLKIDARGSKSGRTLERRRSERIDSLIDDPEVDQSTPRLVEASSALYVPLIVRDHAVGVVVVYDKRGASPRFADADMRIAQAFANRAATAIELSERVGRSAVRALLEGQELERKRLARELHDETGQALTSILLGLRTVEEAGGESAMRAAVAEVRSLVRATLQDVRQLAVELRPKVLDDFGLVAALERLTETFREQTGISLAFQSTLSAERLPPEIETALYRIVQESLTNIVKHARAGSVSITLGRQRNAVTVVVEDDGVGFEPARTREDGLGLIGMRERVALVGGRLTIESRPGAGTTFVVEVPLS